MRKKKGLSLTLLGLAFCYGLHGALYGKSEIKKHSDRTLKEII